MSVWNLTIYRSTLISNPMHQRLLRLIASDADSGLSGTVNYFISTSGIPYFNIHPSTGTIQFQSHIKNISDLDEKRFPIVFQVYAKDLGEPYQISRQNATVIINYDTVADPSVAQWLDQRYEELNISISERFYEKYPNHAIFDSDSDFNGSIMYHLSSSESSLMIVNSPYPHETNIPFRDAPVIKNGQVFSGGIVVTR